MISVSARLQTISSLARKRQVSPTLQLAFVLEALFAGFYVVVTRSLTPIFLVASGYTLSDILAINVVAGLLSIIVAMILYKTVSFTSIKYRLLLAHVVERILWYLIPSGIGSKALMALIYSLAVASTIPTSVFINLTFFTHLDPKQYRILVGRRAAVASTTSVIGQLVMVSVLAVGTGISKYLLLYTVAFISGILASIVVALAPIKTRLSLPSIKREEEAEIKAGNIYLLLIIILAATNLLSIAWVPRVMRDLGAPDYLAAAIGFVQTITSIVASLFWIRRDLHHHRYAIALLSFIPLLIMFTPNPLLHLGIAVIYSFALVGTNLYASITYSTIVKTLGAPKSSIMLSTAGATATIIGSGLGYMLSFSPFLVFTLASILSIIGLIIALTTIPELAIIPSRYTRLYSRILYQSSITSYNFIVFTVSETARTTLKLVVLVLALIILFIIYRTLYYLIQLTGGW
ncbi:MAG: hypothetical protein J7K21_06825 [Desulfurococcales archaeon]|nr:hypothetical protein [Desulfurococcales archaeon]